MTNSPSPLRRLLQSAGSLTLLNFASMGLAFIIGALLARQLGASGYGVYGLAMTVATLAGMITEFGLPVLTMREVAAASATGRWNLARGLELWADRVVLGLSVLLLGGLALAHFALGLGTGSALGEALIWAVLLVPVVALGKLRGLALLSLGHAMAGQFPVMVLRPGLYALALLAAWRTLPRIDAPLAMMFQVVAAFTAMVAVRAAWLRLCPAAMRNAEPEYDRRGWAAACLPMGMTEGLRLLEGQVAVLLLGALATTQEIGIYRVADSVTAVTAVGQSILATAATPLFASLFASADRAGLARVAGATAIGMTLSTLALGLPFLLAGTWLFATVFGAEFGASQAPFLIVWSGLMISGAFGPLQTYANMAGRQRLTTMSFAISLGVNLLVANATIPSMGAAGAALGSLASRLVSNLWLWRELRKRDGINLSIYTRSAWSMFHPSTISTILQARRGTRP